MHNIQLRRTFIITHFFRFVNPVEKNNGGDDKLLFTSGYRETRPSPLGRGDRLRWVRPNPKMFCVSTFFTSSTILWMVPLPQRGRSL